MAPRSEDQNVGDLDPSEGPFRNPTAVPLLFLDLDGTVRHGHDELGRWVNGPDDVVVFPEAIVRMREHRAAGGRIVGVTNQGGIALGHVSFDQVGAAVARTVELAENLFDHVSVCPHHPGAADPLTAQCWCRKPRGGLLVQGALTVASRNPGEVYPAHLARMVGDREEDRGAAQAAGVAFQWAADWRAGRPIGAAA